MAGSRPVLSDPVESRECGKRIEGFFVFGLVSTVCLRPAEHEGDCWPTPTIEDIAGEETPNANV